MTTRHNRREFAERAALAGVATSLLTSEEAQAAGPRLSVLLSTPMDGRALESHLRRVLSGVDVRVFGRRRDFQKSLSSSADGALALAPTLKDVGASIQLRGKRGGRDSEPYVLLAPQPVSASSVGRVGVTEIVGRRQLKGFVSKLLGGNRPTVKQVTKLSDLVALMRFKEADAVLVPQQWVASLQSKTQMKLTATPIQGSVGLCAFARIQPVGSAIETKLKNLGRAANSKLGVEGWS